MALGFLNKLTIGVSVDRMAQAAMSSEAFDGGKGTAFRTTEVIESYFQKYGSAERKWDFHQQSKHYIGYVKIGTRPEFLSVILLQPQGSVAVSFELDAHYGDDLMGMMGKKLFADQVSEQFIAAATPQGR